MDQNNLPESTLYQTKLQVPLLRSQVVLRPRLTQLLQKGSGLKLTLLAAPAGYGKSTLLASWLAGSKKRAAWLSLDKEDNDPARFFSYLIAALRTADPALTQAFIQQAQSAYSEDITLLLPGLVNSLLRFQGDVIVVFDNYHLIEEVKIHQALGTILDRQPDNLHIMIATRADPPLAIGQLRARGDLVEIRAEHLRFTQEEGLAFFNEAMDLALSPADSESLIDRTEGWVTGMKLAGFSLRGHKDPEALIRSFSGSHSYIADYLTDEVIDSLPQLTREFLLRTSILNNFNAALCQAVTGQEQAGQILENIQDLFLISLDSEGRWFRYHQLFADLLQGRLQSADPSLPAVLHSRASTWFLESGYPEQAIDHAIQAGEHQAAVDLLSSRIAEIVWGHGEQYIVQKWLSALPQEYRANYPLLRVYEAFSLFQTGSPPEQVRSVLELAAREDRDQSLRGEIATIRASLNSFEGRLEVSIQHANEALDYLDPEQHAFRSLATRILGISHHLMGDPGLAIAYFSQALALSELTEDLLGAVAALHQMGDMHLVQLKLKEAEELYIRALDQARDFHGNNLPISIRVLASLAQLHYQRNQLSLAQKYAEQSIAAANQYPGYPSYSSFQALAKILQAAGQSGAARQALLTAKRQAEGHKITTFASLAIQAFQAHLDLLQGSTGKAVRWAHELDRQIEIEHLQPFYIRELVLVNLARIQIADGNLDSAEGLLGEIAASAADLGRRAVSLQILVLRSLLEWKQGQIDPSLTSISSALEMAQSEHCIRIFLDEGPDLIPVLQSAAIRGATPSFLAEILKAAAVTEPTRAAKPGILADPLTPRELDVLRLLARGLTSGEIADELVISPSTVRSHLKSIFAKLNVHKRWDAARRAQELGLI